jgi:hypothetical protein
MLISWTCNIASDRVLLVSVMSTPAVQLCQLVVLAGAWAVREEEKARQAELEGLAVEKVWDDFFGWVTPEGE